ncbi:MAG: WD40 repeat domain-containing protein [Anaerolineae bacterium]|nr:WD40 repeat domain-containing protein [Anaerolineae bacterium]
MTLLLLLVFTTGALYAQDGAFDVMTIPVESMAAVTVLSPDDQTVAVYNQFQIYDTEPEPALIVVHLFDINTGDEIGILRGFSDWVTGLSFNSDGSEIVTFHRNGDVSLWHTADQSLIKTIPLYQYGGSWVQFMPDDQSVLYRAGQFLLGTLDVDSAAITRLFGTHIDTFEEFDNVYIRFPGQGDLLIAAAAVSPDGQWLAQSTANDAVSLVDIESGTRYPLRGNSEEMAQFSIRLLAFSNEGQQLIYFDADDSQTHVWDVASQQEVAAYSFGAPVFAVSPDSATLAWADSQTRMVYLAELVSGAEPVEVLALPDSVRVTPAIASVAFTSDGSKLVIGGLFNSDGATNIYVVDLASG